MSKKTCRYHWSHLIWLFALGGLVYAFCQVWRIKHISCLVKTQETAEICEQLSSLKGKSLFFYNLDQSFLFEKILKNQKGQSFQVSDIEKKLPNQLIIHFEQQDPTYRLLVNESVYLANRHNFITKNDKEFKDLILVELTTDYHQQVDPPKIKSELNQKIIDLVSALEKYELLVQTVRVEQTESELKLKQGWTYRFDFSTFTPEIVAQQVKLIEAQLDEEDFASSPKYIDLRFKLPVVKTEAGEQRVETNQASRSSNIDT